MLGGVDGQRRALGLQPAASLGVVRRALARREQGDEAGGGGGVLDDAPPRPGQSGQLAQPLDDDLLDLGQRRGGLPRDAERAEPGGGQVAERGAEGRVGREPAEVARVLHLGHARDHDGLEVGEEAGEGFGLLRGSGRQLARHLARPHLRLNRQLRDPGAVVRDPVDQLMTGRPELLRSHIASSPSDSGQAGGGGTGRFRAARPASMAVTTDSTTFTLAHRLSSASTSTHGATA